MAAQSNPEPLLRLDPPTAPAWVADALGSAAREGEPFEKEGVAVQSRASRDLLWVRARVPGAMSLPDAGFQAAVARCYVAALEFVGGAELHPVRIWNFVPEIRRPSDGGYSRYEVFNTGRQQGVRETGSAGLTSDPVTASAVGHPGRDFEVHVLAGRRGAAPIENPRQCPSYHYSARYGPQPPLFARASRLAGLGALGSGEFGLVSGTASIVGEESTHLGDLSGQLEETLLNLATVAGEVVGRPLGVHPDAEAVSDALSVYRELHVYVVRDADADSVRETVSRAIPGLQRLELASAMLCRPELLVEAEGILVCQG